MFTVQRHERNPILSPKSAHPWEAAATFNWCPVKAGGETTVVYRALSERELLAEPKIHHSIIARAALGANGTLKNRAPFIVPEEEWERFGCEDPRATKIGSEYFICYTALGNYPFSAEGIRAAVAISKDMKTVTERHLATPFNAKGMTLFPKKVRGGYAALLTVHTDMPPAEIALALFKKKEDMWSSGFWETWYSSWQEHALPLKRREDDHVEVGAPPIETKDGWLVVYSHITHYGSERRTFGVEALLLDKENPREVIGRTKGALLVPETFYEETGIVPDVVFPSGAEKRGKMLDIYYGAADTHGCIASVPLDSLLATMTGTQKLVTRFEKNPILAPRPGVSWEAHGVFNPAALAVGKGVSILYRAMSDDDTSTFGFASSKDGFSIDRRSDTPVYTPRIPLEEKSHPGNSGCEDPRLVELDGTVYMTYTAYDGHVPRVAITHISKKDFSAEKWEKWSLPVVITPPEITNKDSCVIPGKVPGGYAILHRVESSICIDIVQSLDFKKEKVNQCIEILSPRKGMWDGEKVGIAGPPVKTPKGWLLFYHGVSESRTYRVGAALLDAKDPTKVLARSADPLLEPEVSYEKEGVVPNVVFPCATVVRSGTVYLYYGGADFVVGVATAKLADVLKALA